MQLNKSARKISQAVLNFALPPKCLSCRNVVDVHGHICPDCWDTITIIELHKCHICGLPFEFDQGKNAICQYCRKDKPKFNKAHAFCTYDGAARRMAVSLKFADAMHLAPHMAKMMLIMGSKLVSKADIIAPVPLHYRRQVMRKYNQASLLAANIAKLTGKPYAPFLLKRTRHTAQQTKLHKKDRKSNVEGAFKVSDKTDIFGKTILLVDDVMTTGATLSVCAKALKERGAKKVYCLVFARVLAF